MIPTNEPWCRDHGPIFLTRDHGWSRRASRRSMYLGSRTSGRDLPSWIGITTPGAINIRRSISMKSCRHASRNRSISRFFIRSMIFEGGSIEVNGSGALLTSEACLLNPNRNPNLTREQIEQRMRDFLGVRDIFWLGDGTEGDDTDGHIDNLARFVSERTVLAVVEDDRADELRAAPGKPARACGRSSWRATARDRHAADAAANGARRSGAAGELR